MANKNLTSVFNVPAGGLVMILSPYSHLPSAFRACIKVSQTMLGLPRYLEIIRDQHSTWQVWLGRLSKVWFLMEGGTGLHHTPGHPETDRSRLCRAAAVTMINEVNVTSWQPEQDSHCPFWRLALPSSRCQMWEGKCCIICRDIGLHAQGPDLSLYYSKKEKGKEILRSPK